MNEQYLAQLRDKSAYPVFRGVVGLVTMLCYLAAAVVFVLGLVGMSQNAGAVFLGSILAVLLALAARVGKEVSLMIADIADATLSMAAQSSPAALEQSEKASSSAPSENWQSA